MPKSASTSLLFDSIHISAASSTPPPKPPYRTKHGHKGPPPPPPPRIDSLLRPLPVAPNLIPNGLAKPNAVTFQMEHVRVKTFLQSFRQFYGQHSLCQLSFYGLLWPSRVLPNCAKSFHSC
jgi:hypothetical protein